MKTVHTLAEDFQIFSKDCIDSSPLYQHLSESVAENKKLLLFCQYVPSSQPAPNILFGAVHYLLLQGAEHPLRSFYPSITNDPKDHQEAFPYFVDFCEQYKQDLIPFMQHKLVQTNEIRRCAYLYPVFCLIYEKTERPLAIIELGTSAGLQLLWDQFSYNYGTHKIYGNSNSDILLTSEHKGKLPPFHNTSPPVIHKVGVDLYPNDLRNNKDKWWLEALIWPEHKERRERFSAAANYFEKSPIELVKGNGIHLLEKLAKRSLKEHPLCIFHTHVANQFSEGDKHELLNQVKILGQHREVFHIYNNMWDSKLHVDYIHNGIQQHHTIGRTNSHGQWFEWELPEKL